jgi:hypothetical protein
MHSLVSALEGAFASLRHRSLQSQRTDYRDILTQAAPVFKSQTV